MIDDNKMTNEQLKSGVLAFADAAWYVGKIDEVCRNNLIEAANRLCISNVIGKLPKTADDVQFGMNANLFTIFDGKIIEVGVLSIADPNDRHWEEYPDGKRWSIIVIDENGNEYERWDGELFSVKESIDPYYRSHNLCKNCGRSIDDHLCM